MDGDRSLGRVSCTNVQSLPPLKALVVSIFVFLIDPVSQVVEKKYHTHFNLDIIALDPWKILAIKDRMFFIFSDVEATIWIAVVAEPGPEEIIRRFGLMLPEVSTIIYTYVRPPQLTHDSGRPSL